jgi:phenylalanyl-tRNA synthetase beta chain
MRGVVESIARTLGGAGASIDLVLNSAPLPGFDRSGAARVQLRTASGEIKHIGECGLVAGDILRAYDLDQPAVVAELNLQDLLDLFPPQSLATPLPLFPGIERDLSFVVPENVAWATLRELIAKSRLDRLESFQFVTAYRGVYRDARNAEHNLGKSGKKAVTVRLRFRDPARTLRHEEVDPQIAALVQAAASSLGAELRA